MNVHAPTASLVIAGKTYPSRLLTGNPVLMAGRIARRHCAGASSPLEGRPG
ncbi:hypothetical protein [Stenotrophomonas sp. YIM B06876]|uniref:hypothetical protein n=1 Tax=Stenotrophomonas sp. YIM B06876 TaxID=3060211 RepID=UPI002739E001|nr:hypothetical protein [Stenotrophomonas sp. YIM B06876]